MRGVQLGFAVEKWNQSGLWVICRSDPDYPARLKAHLKEKAPPILYGAGERALLRGGGLAIVGSRNVDEAGQEFTNDVAAWCARGGMPVVSGGARGVDRIAMGAALNAGGIVVGVLAESLLRRSVARDARQALSDGRLLLISPYHPEARFTVGTAMGRNKLIYAMADYGLVVSAEHGKGGTWEGAEEELKRKPRRPVFVRLSGSVPPGNEKLLQLGALGFPDWVSEDDPCMLLGGLVARSPHAPAREQDLFDYGWQNPDTPGSVRESLQDRSSREPKTPIASESVAPTCVYEAVLPLILSALDEALAVDELAKRLEVAKGQLQVWLRRAVEEKRVRRLTRPVRYIRRNR